MSKAIPFETTHFVRDTCLCFHLQRAARALARRFDDALRPLGLTSWQFSLLMALNQPAAPSIGQRRGLVTVGVDANDRRSRRLKLTRAGCALLARAVPIWRRSHAEIDRLLPRGGSDRLRDDLRALI